MKFSRSILLLVALQIGFISAKGFAACAGFMPGKHVVKTATLDESSRILADCESAFNEADGADAETEGGLLPVIFTSLFSGRQDHFTVAYRAFSRPLAGGHCSLFLRTGKLSI